MFGQEMDVSNVSTAPDKRSQSQQLHLMLLHAYKCQQRAKAGPWKCRVHCCLQMQQLLKHMMTCPSDRKCSLRSDCSLSRQNMKRWSNCTKEECPICIQKKEWQMSVSKEQRSEFIDLMVQSNSITHARPSLREMTAQAKVIEDITYKNVVSRTDYYRVLATEKCKMDSLIQRQSQRNLQNEEQHRRRRLQDFFHHVSERRHRHEQYVARNQRGLNE